MKTHISDEAAADCSRHAPVQLLPGDRKRPPTSCGLWCGSYTRASTRPQRRRCCRRSSAAAATPPVSPEAGEASISSSWAASRQSRTPLGGWNQSPRRCPLMRQCSRWTRSDLRMVETRASSAISAGSTCGGGDGAIKPLSMARWCRSRLLVGL